MENTRKEILENLKNAVTEYALAEVTRLKSELKWKYVFWCERHNIPTGCRPIEVYENEKEFVVLFGKEPLPESHNCDEMGCSTVSHVRLRIPKDGKRA